MRGLLDQLLNGTDNRNHKLLVTWMWRLVFLGIAAFVLLFIGLSFTNLPSVTELENPKSNEASQVLAADGNILGKFYTENRVRVNFDDLSPYLVQALVATEDERFYEHSGIDFVALGRAVVKTGLLGQRSAGGASTITQQLAKLLFTGTKANSFSKRVLQKFREWIIAVRLERKYTKEEIIAMYLNRYDFINGAQGIRAAAEIYFNTSPDSLTLEQSAMLVGMLKNASLFNPLRHPDTVMHRRMVVLNQMVKNGYITQARYDQVRDEPLGLRFTRQTHIDGLAPYFRMELAKDIKNILERPEYRKSDGTVYDIYRDGLKIRTTIDPVLQEIAEEEMRKHMASVQKAFFQHWRNRDPWTYDSGSETDVPVSVRKEYLGRLIRESDRYQQLREEYLSDVLRNLERETELTFHDDDREVERLVAEAEKPGVIDDLVERKLITASLATQYRKVLRSSLFPRLRTQWDALQQAVRKDFNQAVPMTVFAYNAEMEKDTTMTPLDSIRYHRMFLQTGIMAVEPATGYVKAWVGGIDHKYFQYDHVRTPRQVGSTFKPFIYAASIAMRNLSPCFQVTDTRITITPGEGEFGLLKSWAPSNATGKYSGRTVNLMQGLRESINTVSVYLMKELQSTEPVRELVNQMGIDKELVPPSPSIALGAMDLTVMQMTGAYTAFANNGVYNRPTFLVSIEDRYGRTIYQAIPEERQALGPAPNYAMITMLQYAATNMGNIKGPVGGKTGTTNDYSDGWFMGITPNLVVGTWTGGEDRWIAFRNLAQGQGAYLSKPFFRNYITRLQNDPRVDWDESKQFYRPPGDLGIVLDCSLYRGQRGDGDYRSDPEFGEDAFGEDPAPEEEGETDGGFQED